MTDWKPGDLALCVDARPSRCPCGHWCASALDYIWRVEAVTSTRLIFDEQPAHSFPKPRFRKILPDLSQGEK